MHAPKWAVRVGVCVAAVVAAATVTMPSASAASLSGNWIAGQLTAQAGPPATAHYVTRYRYGTSVFSYDDTGLTVDGNLAFVADGPLAYASHIALTSAWIQQNKVSYYSDGSGTATCTGHSPSGELYAGPLAKTAFEELANNVSASTELALLACLQGSVTPGRFSDSSAFGDFSNAFSQSFAIMDFVKSPSGTAAAEAASYLQSQQCPSGAFTDVFGSGCAIPVTDSTAMAAMALQAFANHSTGAARVAAAASASKAAKWLVSNRTSAGPFENYWMSAACDDKVSLPSVSSTALAVLGLRSVLGPNIYTDRGRIWLAVSPQTQASGEMSGCSDSDQQVQASNDVRATTVGILGKDGITYPALLGI